MVFLKDAPVMHRSVMQKTVALLSWKTELNAAVLCVQDMLYAKNLIEMGDVYNMSEMNGCR